MYFQYLFFGADAFVTDLTFQEKCKKMKEESMKDMEISEHEER